MTQVPPDILARAAISVERDLSTLVGEELIKKYASDDAKLVFKHITGKVVDEVAAQHNPFWHYALQTWYHNPQYRSLLYLPRHRDEVASAVVQMALGKLDSYDGIHHQYPRRALKSFFMKMMADWLPKRHKIVDSLDILLLYSHNLEKRAFGALESIKGINRWNPYIKRHFPEFVIPSDRDWGEKGQWNWPCRDLNFLADQMQMTGEAANTRKAGAGYNYRLLDDWEAEDSRDSEIIREQLADKYDQVRQLNAPPWCREWVGGTPYHVQSLYKPMLEQKHDDGTPRYFVIRTPALDDDNKPNFPTIPRLSVESLAKERANEIRRRGTDRFWYLQYMLDPTLTGEQAMQFDWFQPLTGEEHAKKFGILPKMRAVFCDPAWKGDENHQEGCDAAIGVVDIYSIAGQLDFVLLDLHASNDMESDEGADEMLRMMNKWHTHLYSIEQQADKSFVGLMKRVWRSTPRDSRPINMPRFIDAKSWNKRAKNDRISTVGGHAKMGHWYYLTSIPKLMLDKLRTQANEYPASVKRDILDMMAQAHADEILARYVPVAVPAQEMIVEKDPLTYVSRYTGLPAVYIH